MRAGSAQQPLPPPTAEADEVRRAAEEILSRPEFQEPPRSLYQRFMDWLAELIGDLVGTLLANGAGSAVAWGLLFAIVALLTWLIVRAVQRGSRVGGAADGAAITLDPRRPAEAWLADAERFEAEGRWRDALRCRYRALVATLARTGAVEEVPGRTAGEYRALVRQARPAVAEPFADATDRFERAWYGNDDVRSEDAAAFREVAERVTTGSSS